MVIAEAARPVYLVMRPLPTDANRTYQAGETIDGADIPPHRVRQLIDQRYIQPAVVMAQPAKEAGRGTRTN